MHNDSKSHSSRLSSAKLPGHKTHNFSSIFENSTVCKLIGAILLLKPVLSPQTNAIFFSLCLASRLASLSNLFTCSISVSSQGRQSPINPVPKDFRILFPNKIKLASHSGSGLFGVLSGLGADLVHITKRRYKT